MERSFSSAVFLLSLLSFSSFAAVPAGAFVLTIRATPVWPTVDDRIGISIGGEFPDPCWTFRQATVDTKPGNVLVRVEADFSPGICLPVTQPYSTDVSIGLLEAGEWRIVVEDPQETKEITLTVASRETFPSADENGDGAVDISDAVGILEHLFIGGKEPACPKLADANGDGALDLSDSVFVLTYLFLGGEPPANGADCIGAADCGRRPWIVKCRGHWSCACGTCREACGGDCGDGICDRQGGETEASCPGDCAGSCRPFCDKIGSRSEGWYDSCTGQLYDWALCDDCKPECRNCGTFSEGWYDSCTGELITWADCDCKE